MIDSVQTLCLRRARRGRPGPWARSGRSPRGCCGVAKEQGTAVILVGHVTKEGSLAGPRVLEHMVDCVLQFEGERERPYRELRALKNRFGSTSEAALFEMREAGLVEVLDASARFVADATRAPGGVVLATMEGSRPLLVEVQALVAPSELEQPRRVVSGLHRNRLALVLAILARHGRVRTGACDVFVNVVGGVRLEEPGADLAVALAVASAARGQAAGGRSPGVLRRARADRRAALGGAPRATPAGGRTPWPGGRDRAPGQRSGGVRGTHPAGRRSGWRSARAERDQERPPEGLEGAPRLAA